MVAQQQQSQQQQQQMPQQPSVPSYGDYASFDAAGLGQMTTATVSAVDDVSHTSHIDELVPLSTTAAAAAAIMSSVSAALEPTASNLIYMDPDASYSTSMKDSRSLLNEQTNVCKVRYTLCLKKTTMTFYSITSMQSTDFDNFWQRYC